MLVQEVPVPPHHRRWRSDPHRGLRDRPIREDLSSLERLDYRLSTLRVETGPPGELVLPLLLRAAGAACAPQARPGDAQRSGSVIVVSHAALRTICWEVGRSRWCGRMRMRDLGAGGAPVACVEKGVEHAASAISGPDCSRPSHPRHRALVATAAGAGLRWARRLASADALDLPGARLLVIRTVIEVSGTPRQAVSEGGGRAADRAPAAVARHPSALSRWCIRRRRSGCITSKSGIPTKSTTRSRGGCATPTMPHPDQPP